MIQGSGNHMEDEEDRQQNKKKLLPCGCYKYCTCDIDDEVFEKDEEKIKDISIDITE